MHRDKDDDAVGPPGVASGGERFPATRMSVLVAAKSDDAALRRSGFDLLVGVYWKPVYKYLRLRWNATPEDAQDWTQGFFSKAFEKGFFDRYENARARFRTFLRTCLDGFVANEKKAASRQKRGGGEALLSLDFAQAEGEIGSMPRGPLEPEARGAGEGGDEIFRREWVRSLFESAVEALRERCAATGKRTHFAIFERYDLSGDDDLNRPRYADLARDHGLTETQVTNHLAFARREFRRLALEHLRALTGDEAEFEEEARALFGPRR